MLTIVATKMAVDEEEHEEQILIGSDTAPFRNAVERELGKYDSLQAVARLTYEPLGEAHGEGIRTYLLGETLARLYPAVSYVAFVRRVAHADLNAYARTAGASLRVDEGGVPAWKGVPATGGPWHYFLENASPASAQRFGIGVDLSVNAALTQDFERARRVGSQLVTPADPKSRIPLEGSFVVTAVPKAAILPLASSPQVDIEGFFVAGINFNKLMRDALVDAPPHWWVRLTALPDGGDEGQSPGIVVFDNQAGGMLDKTRYVKSLAMKPMQVRIWNGKLQLDISGRENHDYLMLDLLPWVTFILGLLLTLAVFMAAKRLRLVRAQSVALTIEARTSNERFRDIVETSSDWIWELDAGFNFRYSSPTSRALLGYEPEELVGRSMLSLRAPTDVDAAAPQVPPKAENAAPYSGLMHHLLRKDGAEVIVERAATPIVDDQGAIIGYRGIDRDVTEQRQFHQRLSQLHEDLARHMQSNLAGQLLSGLAHELNQPLSAILTYNQACLRLLKSGNADPAEITAAMQSTADNVVHARDILQRLRRFTARREPRAVPTPLVPLVKNCFGLIEIRLRSLSVETRINIPRSMPQVLADPILATQVFLNVFNNAIDAMLDSEVRRIVVTARVLNGRNVQVHVEDSGPGIAAENLPRLFDAYFTTNPSGTGIGLPLCRSIIEAMGGSISVSSSPGRGAVVDLLFPIARPEHASREAATD